MNFLILSLVFLSFLNFSGICLAQTSGNGYYRNPVTKFKLFAGEEKEKHKKFPLDKILALNKQRLAKADHDNMPLHIPNMKKSIKIPVFKPSKDKIYTIKKYYFDKKKKQYFKK